MFKRKSKLADKGELSGKYNEVSPMDAIRKKAAAFAKENPQLQGGKAEFKTAEAPKVKDAADTHRAEMRQDRVPGFTFSVGSMKR